MQICQIPYVNFKTQVNSSPSFVFLFSVMKDNSSVLFQLKQYILYSKEAHQVLGSKFFKYLKSILKQQVSSSSNFASFFIVRTHNSSVNFRLILFQLWIKRSHQSHNFDTFKCSGENFLYSSCHF